ncbi:growth/differentiation factor 6-A [Polyodon spathula]|uniref:growth/differentiation factor 6-A n=1 Tax=Polyodon spathula TaxID=7913 RepID=UPI001B7DEE8F|nr:growth/differentiation factor 6-A [Polyodon spathula]
MDLMRVAALVLWFSFCFGDFLEAAVLGSAQYPLRADDNGLSSHLEERNQGEPAQISRYEDRRIDTVVPHEYMVSLYRTLSEIEKNALNVTLVRTRKHANTVTSFVDQGNDNPSTEPGQRYLFNMSTLSKIDELVGAELRILRKTPSNLPSSLSKGGNLYRILLYSCREGNDGQHLLDSRTMDILDIESSKWEVFDVWGIMRGQKHRTENLLCFDLIVISESSKEASYPQDLGFSRHALQTQEKALLVAFTHTRKKENLFKEIRDKVKSMSGMDFLGPPDPGQKSHSKHRRRRRSPISTRSAGSGGRGNGKRSKTRCSRKPLHVNFKELGWDDWIIAPLDYEAYHCEGICDFPLRSHLEPTNHAIIQTLMNSMDPESTPPSCCVPSKLSPISILYIDSGNNVVYKQYEDMVVESCGCR